MQRLAALLLTLAAVTAGCRRSVTYPALGSKLASPVDVALADDDQHFFVLNADFDNTYNQGSVVTLSKDGFDANGNPAGVVKVPRMGRTLTVAGNDLLVTFDYQDDTTSVPHALLFDATDPTHLVQKQDFTLNCSPISTAMRKGYGYFAIMCSNGELNIGTLAADRTQSTLKEVRFFGLPRRAMYIDPVRNLLLAFPTQLGKQTLGDLERLDVSTCSTDLTPVCKPAANDIPDDYEVTHRVQGDLDQRQTYQYFVYDFNAEKANAPGCSVSATESCAFPYRDITDPIVQRELRWVYFSLANFDGTPDPSPHFNDIQWKFYRTNFYAAKPDADDPDSFYLSQRGAPDISPYANHLVKVTFTGDIRPATALTGDVLKFERVYGFKGGESSKFAYPGDFQLAKINGQKLIVVNNFRNLIDWVRGDTYFSLAAQSLDSSLWFNELVGDLTASDIRSYFQVAINSKGRGMSCSFYGNQVIMFDLVPGVGFMNTQRLSGQ